MDPTLVADKLAIHELAYRYARLIDDRSYSQADQVFAEDANLIGPNFNLHGREEIQRSLPSIEHFRATFHCVYNQLVEVRGDEAEGETYCVASHLYEKGDQPFKLDWGIRYQDRCRRESAGWRFTRRELIVVWRQKLPAEAND